MKPGEDVFTEADLEPDPYEPQYDAKSLFDTAVATVAVITAGLWAGAIVGVALCGGSTLVELSAGVKTPTAMIHFDSLAIGCAVVLVGCEVARTFIARRQRRSVAGRIRRLVAIVLAGCASYGALVLTPGQSRLLSAATVNAKSEAGRRLSVLRERSAWLNRGQLSLAAILIALHMFTLRRRQSELDEGGLAPLPPGPSA